MGYIGAQPATNFETVRKQVSTTNSGTTITLDFAVSSVQDILVTVNAVVQSYDNYSVSGTTLTLGGTLNNDRVEILYVGRTFQTVSPAIGTVTNDMLSGSIANSKLANSSITLNGSAVSLGSSASVDNTPAFLVRNSSLQSLTDDTHTKAQFNTVIIDTASAYDNVTNYRFTVPSGQGGRYFIYSKAIIDGEVSSNLDSSLIEIRKNGLIITGAGVEFLFFNNPIRLSPVIIQTIVDLVATDYIEVFVRIEANDSTGGRMASNGTFGGYKLIS